VLPRDTYLGQILDAHRAAARSDRRDLHELIEQAEAAPAVRGFTDRIADSSGLAVIAEIKRRSPSKGEILPGLDPADLARDYSSGGATCISVLTDREFFSGSAEDLVAAREACTLPVLRKDFVVSQADVCDARIMGADAVLLIAAALNDEELGALHTLARELEMDSLIEVHDEQELDRALDVGAELVGVNQRDLYSFDVDRGCAARLAPSIPAEVVAVAESGLQGPEDVRRLAEVGYQAVLVGEHLLRTSDRSAAVSALRHPRIGSRRSMPVRSSPPLSAV
jgi:indole-3-glycerol phosphate synthase